MNLNRLFSPKNIGLFSFYATIGGILEAIYSNYSQNQSLQKLQNQVLILETKTQSSLEVLQQNTIEHQRTQSMLESFHKYFKNKIESINESYEKVNSSASILKQMQEVVNDTNLTRSEKIDKINELLQQVETHVNNLDELNNNIEILNKAIELFNKKDSSHFLDSISQFFNQLITQLDLLHQVALMNILGTISLIFISYSIGIIYYGDYLIQRFELETKYPKLAKWIQLRRKLKNYSLLWNLFLASTVIISMLIVNILIFFMM